MKILAHFIIFFVFVFGIHRYLVQKSEKCENKECECPIRENLREGYLVVGALSLAALCLMALIEVAF
ncbi:MAG TPA: hypothetical protein P5160_04855 [Candidatus Omnitrophota bacterium]|nr:hypothetical protein [Candidatus Omnitrophota bacterium]